MLEQVVKLEIHFEAFMRLLLVHGIAQQGRSAIALEEEWVSALKDGMRNANLSPVEMKVTVPFFGDELFERARRFQVRSEDEIRFLEGIAREIDIQQRHTGLVASPTTFEPKRRGQYRVISGAKQKRGAGELGATLPDSVREILGRLEAKLPDVANLSFRIGLRTVYAYLNKKDVRGAIDAIVLKAIDQYPDEPTLLVGHSLGSVVAYNILTTCKASWLGFITLGSPLGLTAVTDRLDPHKPRIPELKSRWAGHGGAAWINAFDPRDIVALKPICPPHWEPPALVDNINDVDNFTENRHGIRGYLSDSRVASAIHSVLSAGV